MNTWIRLVGFMVVTSFCSCLADRAEEPCSDENSDGLVQVLSQRELCRCFFGEEPFMIDTSAAIQCLDDEISLGGLTYDKMKLDVSKEEILIYIFSNGKSIRFRTAFFDCVLSLYISQYSTVRRVPDNPDDWVAARTFDGNLRAVINNYVRLSRSDTQEMYVPIWPNDLPRVTQTIFTVNGNDVVDAVIYSEHNLDDIRNINSILRDSLLSRVTDRDSGIFIINAFYYENDQVRIHEIE